MVSLKIGTPRYDVPPEFRAFVVEGAAGFIELVQEALPGAALVCARSVPEAVALLAGAEFDLVFLDMDLPERELQRVMVEARRLHEDQPIICFTAGAAGDKALTALRLGAIDVFARDTDKPLLMHRIMQHRKMIQDRIYGLVVDRYTTRKTAQIRLPCDIRYIPQAANRVAEDAYRAGNLSIDRAQSLNLAVFESLTNALEHGCLGITYADKTREIKTGRYVEYLQNKSAEAGARSLGITLTYRITSKWILVRVQDPGPGFKAQDYLKGFAQKKTEDYHGRGVILLTSMVDRVRYNDSGNAVTLLMKRG